MEFGIASELVAIGQEQLRTNNRSLSVCFKQKAVMEARKAALTAHPGRATMPRPVRAAAGVALMLAITLLPLVAYAYVNAIGSVLSLRDPDFTGAFDLAAFLSKPANIVLATGAITLILAAKLIDLAFRALLYPRRMLLVFTVVATVTALSNTVLIAHMAALSGQITDLDRSNVDLRREIAHRIADRTPDNAQAPICSTRSTNQVDCDDINELREQVKVNTARREEVMESGVHRMEFWFRFLILAGEVTGTAAAFMFTSMFGSGQKVHIENLHAAAQTAVNDLTTQIATIEAENAATAVAIGSTILSFRSESGQPE